MTNSKIKRLLEAASPIASWWAFHEAGEELNSRAAEEPNQFDADPNRVVLNYMGNGASTTVTVKQIREFCAALDEAYRSTRSAAGPPAETGGTPDP